MKDNPSAKCDRYTTVDVCILFSSTDLRWSLPERFPFPACSYFCLWRSTQLALWLPGHSCTSWIGLPPLSSQGGFCLHHLLAFLSYYFTFNFLCIYIFSVQLDLFMIHTTLVFLCIIYKSMRINEKNEWTNSKVKNFYDGENEDKISMYNDQVDRDESSEDLINWNRASIIDHFLQIPKVIWTRGGVECIASSETRKWIREFL